MLSSITSSSSSAVEAVSVSAATASAASSLLAIIVLGIAIGIGSSTRRSSSIALAFATPPPQRQRHHHHHHQQQRQPTAARLSSLSPSSSLAPSSLNDTAEILMWDAKSQTYLNGIVPSNHDDSSDIHTLLSLNGDGKLKIFGYGSLCWHAGSEGGVLSLANREEEEEEEEELGEEIELHHHLRQHQKKEREDGTSTTTSTTTTTITTNKLRKGRRGVTTSRGMAIGYQRIWSQRSADHRGTPQFNGIVCTLLSDEEVYALQDEEISNQMHPQGLQQAQPLVHLNNSSSSSSSNNNNIDRRRRRKVSITEGLIYTIDADLVHECLAELDFREKGGYSRDIIDVVEVGLVENGSAATGTGTATGTSNTTATNNNGTTVEKKYTKALLYRGTPNNPAFWKRVIFDLQLAAAIISLAIGPSGPNDAYLYRLHEFLLATTHGQPAALTDEGAGRGDNRDVRTGALARMIELLQSEYRPIIMFGAGSNEHNQLLLTTNSGRESGMQFNEDVNNSHNGDDDRNGNASGYTYDEHGVHYSRKEVHELTEMVLVVPRMQNDNSNDENDTDNGKTIVKESATTSNPVTWKTPADHDPRSLHAGGGHSALLTHGGDLFLWGWNDAGQLGRRRMTANNNAPFSNLVPPLSNIKVAAVALGHTHTLVVEKGSGHLFGFGEDSRGQVSGCCRARDDNTISPYVPRRIQLDKLETERFTYVAAGLFHSAAITKGKGDLITWGCGRFGQCLRVDATPPPRQDDVEGASTVGRWRPPDGCKLMQVACGRRHTVVLDEHGRVWTLGDNKYGQLGRERGGGGTALSITEPQLVDGPLGKVGSGCFAIYCGWSHVLAVTRGADDSGASIKLYGWGRNDRGQLGLGSGDQSTHQNHVLTPQVLVTPLLNTEENSFCEEEGGKNSIHTVCCGAESSHIIDAHGNIYSTGWNEHGNLATGHLSGDGGNEDACYLIKWTVATGAVLVAPPLPTKSEGKKTTLFAAGGAHLITLSL